MLRSEDSVKKALGATLAAALDALQQWAGDHIDEVAAAQRRYDAAAPAPN
jgi:DNA-binding HxlR family transcriptional regulator